MSRSNKTTIYENSLFCKRLEVLSAGSSTELKNLNTATERLISHAETIGTLVVRYLPQFTLHDGTHLENVLGFMEELAGGQDGIARLSAGDCAMAVWAAFIHDLGMVLEASELAALDAADRHDATLGATVAKVSLTDQRVQDWRAYRDGHEHWRSVRLDPSGDQNRRKLGIIRAAFIRDSHARIDGHTNHCRIADWLENISKSDRLITQALEDYSLGDRLVRVAVSHNQDIRWLPRQLAELGLRDANDQAAEDCGTDLGVIHWTWLGWLLRLADVFDCDASRTPRVLFEHGGITDARSTTEWKKHLSIPAPPRWRAGVDKESLLFTCQRCPGPVVEKSLHQIVGWMNDEIGKCRSAWHALPAECRTDLELRLPSQARVEIKTRVGDYLYEDIEFRLDRDAVVELLMGESLYGGPELALRELVQNALDAVHLRDQRNKLALSLERDGGTEKARHPHEPWGAVPPGVRVTWGHESDGRQWIKVRDNGVGMTVGAMRRFLTQVGKSYYKSDDFFAEQELMRRHGILCTAISQFGIGFLSVFMLADHVEIHTRPVGAKDHPDKTKADWQETERFPFRADIHGPHGLIAFYPEAVSQTGTTVTLWLKKHPLDAEREQFYLPPWNRELVLDRLRREFYERYLSDEQQAVLDKFESDAGEALLCEPAFEIGRFIVWPLYPVELGPAAGAIVLDQAFHFRELIPLDVQAIDQRARELGEEIPEIASAGWQCCDWIDEHRTDGGVEGTGSRVRLVTLMPRGKAHESVSPAKWSAEADYLPSGKPRLLLATCTDAQLPDGAARYQCLVNGVRIVPGFVPSNAERDCHLAATIASFPAWPGIGGCLWLDLRGGAMPRLRADRSAPVRSQRHELSLGALFQRWLNSFPSQLPVWLRSILLGPEFQSRALKGGKLPARIGLPGVSPVVLESILLAESRSASSAYYALPRLVGLEIVRDSALVRRRNLLRAYDVALAVADDHRQESDLTRKLAKALKRNPVYADFSSKDSSARKEFKRLLNLHIASEIFWPSWKRSLPAVGLDSLDIPLSSCLLNGPVHIALESQVRLPDWLGAHYDLVAPFTALSLPRLRRAFKKWGEDRRHRAIFMLPFLFGHSPWRGDSKEIIKLPFRRLMLFMPNLRHEEWLFAEHSRDEWAQGAASALWDLDTGKVLYADGIHTEESMWSEGRSLREWLSLSN